MLTYHLQLRMKSKTECHFRLFVKIKHLPLLSTANLPLVVYTHFDNFLPSTYKFGNVYTLVYRGFRICSSWTKLYTTLICLKQIFLKNGYPENFIKKCFKIFIDNINVVKETNLIFEKKPLVLALPYLGSMSLQTRNKLKTSLKNVLN